MSTKSDAYQLPTVEFVGGETQRLSFQFFRTTYSNMVPLTSTTSNFSVISSHNKRGSPIISKSMEIRLGDDGLTMNVLYVELDSSETLNLFGKYIYQIVIKDVDGDIEIPMQGIMYVTNNINQQANIFK